MPRTLPPPVAQAFFAAQLAPFATHDRRGQPTIHLRCVVGAGFLTLPRHYYSHGGLNVDGKTIRLKIDPPSVVGWVVPGKALWTLAAKQLATGAQPKRVVARFVVPAAIALSPDRVRFAYLLFYVSTIFLCVLLILFNVFKIHP